MVNPDLNIKMIWAYLLIQLIVLIHTWMEQISIHEIHDAIICSETPEKDRAFAIGFIDQLWN